MSLSPNKILRIALAVVCLLAAAVALLLAKVPSRLLARLNQRVSPISVVFEMTAGRQSFSVVQIGAYIGKTDNDPLYSLLVDRQTHADQSKMRKRTKAVFVEPIREYFDLLCENYSDLQGAVFENVAIAESDGEREMFRLKVNPADYGFPDWLAQLSSLKKERMEGLWEAYEKNPEYQKFYLENRVAEKVQCMTLQELLEKHEMQDLDLLLIDAEGYDYEILKTLDYTTTMPKFINFERVLLQEEEGACRRMLESHGYHLFDWHQDTFCVRDDCWNEFKTAERRLLNRVGPQAPKKNP